MSKLKHALELAAAGHRVFPLTPNGKTPAHAGVNWRKIASSDPARVAEMWTDPVFDTEIDYNIGIALGAVDLVFDEDVSDGKQGDKSRELLEMIYEPLPATFTVRSARGGRHRYYRTRQPVGNSASKVGKHIDIKSDGGFVVGPGSTTPDGEYVVEIPATIADAPQWLTDMAGAPRERVTAATTDAVVDLDRPAAISRAAEWLEQSAPDAGTYSVAAKVKDFGISQEQCLEIMMDHWPPAEAKGEDHIQFRVENAYRYGQNAPGIASAEAEFDAVEIDSTKPSPSKKGLNVRNITSFGWSTAQGGYLVQGFLNYKMLAMMSAPSNAGKSPLALDLAAHVATGRPWRGRKVKPAYVLHYSTEGFTGLGNRMEALRREHFDGAANVPFDFVSGSLDLRTSTKDAKAIIEAVKTRSAMFGVAAGLVVIDTLSHALGGGDESNPEHVRAVLKNCSEIATRTGAAVMILHHPTKDASSDYRGSSIMLNDIDLMIKVDVDAKTKRRTVTTPRVKEFAEIDPLHFNIKVVRLGEDEEGDAITSIVVDWVDVLAAEFDVTLSPAAQEMFDIMEQMDAAERDAIDAGEANVENDKCDIWMPWNAMQISFLSQIKGAKGKGVGRSALFKIRQELSQAGKIKRDQQNQWAIVKSH